MSDSFQVPLNDKNKDDSILLVEGIFLSHKNVHRESTVFSNSQFLACAFIKWKTAQYELQTSMI